MEHNQFSFGDPLRIMWEPPGKLTVEDLFSFLVLERLDHELIIAGQGVIVKGYYSAKICSFCRFTLLCLETNPLVP